jgi:hypothetical protein
MKKIELLYICPSCGFEPLEEPIYHGNTPNFGFICPCCFYEFGIQEETFVEYREFWIRNLAPFMDVDMRKPETWTIADAKNQLLNLKKIDWQDMPERMQRLNPDWNINYDFGTQ